MRGIIVDNVPLVASSLSFLTSILVPQFNNMIDLGFFFNNMTMPFGLLMYALAAGGDIFCNTGDKKYNKIPQFEKSFEYLLQQYQINGTV